MSKTREDVYEEVMNFIFHMCAAVEDKDADLSGVMIKIHGMLMDATGEAAKIPSSARECELLREQIAHIREATE